MAMPKIVKTRRRDEKEMTASQFMDLSDAAKDRIHAELEAETPEQREARARPLNAVERRQWSDLKQKLRGRGRPKLGKNGVTKVSISVELSLMKQADAYADRHGLTRSQLFAEGLRGVIREQRASISS